jgi:hypothetical protein
MSDVSYDYVLHYKGDLLSSATPRCWPGRILGHDMHRQPFVITDVDYNPDDDLTTVHLIWARTEDAEREAKIEKDLMAEQIMARSGTDALTMVELYHDPLIRARLVLAGRWTR